MTGVAPGTSTAGGSIDARPTASTSRVYRPRGRPAKVNRPLWSERDSRRAGGAASCKGPKASTRAPGTARSTSSVTRPARENVEATGVAGRAASI